MQEDETRGKSGQELVARRVLNTKATENETQQTKSFLHYPLSSINYSENYSQANHKYFNGLC